MKTGPGSLPVQAKRGELQAITSRIYLQETLIMGTFGLVWQFKLEKIRGLYKKYKLK
ncbi:hypothetical protein D3C79_1054040 [compost metagenome]